MNSTNKDLDLNIGTISRQLLKAAGESVQEECWAKYPKGIGLGQVALTSAGDMDCKALFHGQLSRWDEGKGQSESVSRKIFNR